MLHAQGNQAEGRWVGLSYDGPILTGHATLARTREDAQAAMRPPHRPFRRPSMTDTDLVEVTITAPDLDWLTDLCHQVVDARLASSAYVIHPITSIYSRDDDVQVSSAD